MESNHKTYYLSDSVSRLDEILDGAESNYEEVNSIPSRSTLTYSNGYYVNCSCCYIDIRKSSGLPDKYKRPKLAKLYRAYISETVAILNANENCAEINIHGDGVWGVFDTPYKRDIDSVFASAARLSSLIDILNCRSVSRGYDPIGVGIGLDWGRSLMIKAGNNGSGLNDVVWMGDVVNKAAELSHYGNSTWSDREIMATADFHGNLNDHNKGLMEYNSSRNCFHGYIVNIAMNDWFQENCSSK